MVDFISIRGHPPFGSWINNFCPQVWETLRAAFGKPSQARIVQLQMQSNALKKGDINISTYLWRVKLISDKLAAFGYPIPQQFFNATIYTNLKVDYGEIVTILTNWLIPIMFPDLLDAMTNHEIQLQARKLAIIANQTQYMTAMEDSGNRWGNGSGFRGRSGGRGSGGRRKQQQPRRDLCPVYGWLGHSYKCTYRVQPNTNA